MIEMGNNSQKKSPHKFQGFKLYEYSIHLTEYMLYKFKIPLMISVSIHSIEHWAGGVPKVYGFPTIEEKYDKIYKIKRARIYEA